MTTEAKRLSAAMLRWAAHHPSVNGKRLGKVRHLHTRCYVLAKPAPLCLVVVCPWHDSEPQCQAFDKEAGGARVFRGEDFDKSLSAGDWCAVGYVSTESSGWSVAIPIDTAFADPVSPRRRKRR